jgi:4-hydroxythreonine-4-phosphate dehydrogenase
LLLTMGDVAGIGPEIIARAWPDLIDVCQPVVVGDPGWLRRALNLVGSPAEVKVVDRPAETAPTAALVPCLAGSDEKLEQVAPGKVSGSAGKAAYDFLCRAIDLTLAAEADGIVTAPLHKEGLRAAGLAYPGHTEILAERTGTRSFAMMLYARGGELPRALGVLHVTLHCALRDVFCQLSRESVMEKIRLLDTWLTRLLGRQPRLGVAALNPHASDGGLFGDEEQLIIKPAIESARTEGIDASGPWPSDTLFVRGRRGDFDGIVAMYHDQGHIALKLLGGHHAVNVTVGLPLVRTSVAHGTAYDIAWKGVADARGLVEAAGIAAQLVKASNGRSGRRRATEANAAPNTSEAPPAAFAPPPR